jgi:magnesium-protoporphyrin O-methyltransferase
MTATDAPTAPGSNDKTVVREYFNSTGFDRWRRIYGTTDDVNKVQKNIRIGHQKTVDTVLSWFDADGDLGNQRICDAGCGVGSLSIPLLERGATVYASDIAQKMVEEAEVRAKAVLDNLDKATFEAKDLEQITGEFDIVVCLDVLIHYPDDEAAQMIQHLASLAGDRLLLSFAPNTPVLNVLKRIGEFFPGPSKTTRAYQHREQDIVEVLEGCGFEIKRKALNKAPFYFSRLLEAVRKP